METKEKKIKLKPRHHRLSAPLINNASLFRLITDLFSSNYQQNTMLYIYLILMTDDDECSESSEVADWKCPRGKAPISELSTEKMSWF